MGAAAARPHADPASLSAGALARRARLQAGRLAGAESWKPAYLSYPESWRELSDPEGDQNVVLLAREVGRPAVEAAQVTLTRVNEEAPFGSLTTNIKVFNRNQLEDASFVEERDVDVDGADEARLLVTDYELPADGRRIPYRARQIIALKEPDLQLNVGVMAPRDAYDRFDADAILDSITID